MKIVVKIALAAFGLIIIVAIGQVVIDSLTSTVSWAEFERDAKYRGYTESELQDFRYSDPAAYTMDVLIAQAEPTYSGVEIPVHIMRDGFMRYIYKKGFKRVFVEKHEILPYPGCVVWPSSMISTSSQPDISVGIKFGESTHASKIRIDSRKEDDDLYHFFTYIDIDDDTMKKIRASEKDLEFIIEDQTVATLRYGEMANVNDVHPNDAESYHTIFTKDNLDKALRYYTRVNDQGKIDEISGLLAISRRFRKFHWAYDEITENPDAVEAQGFVLDELKILYWPSDDTLIFGTTERVNGSESEMKVYGKYSFLLPDVRVYMNDKGEERDVVSGIIIADPNDVDPTKNSIEHWIVSYIGRKPIVVEGKTVYLPKFRLVRIIAE